LSDHLLDLVKTPIPKRQSGRPCQSSGLAGPSTPVDLALEPAPVSGLALPGPPGTAGPRREGLM